MEKLVGVGASPGIAIGVAHVLASRVEIHERRIAAEQVEAELRRFERALAWRRDAQLARIQAQIAEREGDEQQYRILEAHRLMLSDVHLVERARRLIRDDKAAAEWAVRKSLDQIQAVFERIEDPVLPRSQERRRARRRAAAAQPGRRRRFLVARGGARRAASPSRTSCRPPTPPSWAAPRRRGSAPRAAAARRTPRSWRARWACRTSSASRASAAGSGPA